MTYQVYWEDESGERGGTCATLKQYEELKDAELRNVCRILGSTPEAELAKVDERHPQHLRLEKATYDAWTTAKGYDRPPLRIATEQVEPEGENPRGDGGAVISGGGNR